MLLLNKWATGAESSFVKLMQTSPKFSLVFEETQKKCLGKAVQDATTFSNVIRNFSHKEARYDSRSEPLFRLLFLACDLLRDVDSADRRFAIEMLKKCGGPEVFDRLTCCAVLADAMILANVAINASQVLSHT